MTLMEIVRMLREAKREGAAIDDPEGSRYVNISDTLALEMADCIESEAIEAKEYGNL